jgi:hypothetical protein
MNGFIDAANTERNTQPIVKELADSGAGHAHSKTKANNQCGEA